MTSDRKPFTVPFTGGELQVLRQWQQNPWTHPLTCNGGLPPSEHVHNEQVVLRPTLDGLVCPACYRVQDWVPDSLGDEPIWRRLCHDQRERG